MPTTKFMTWAMLHPQLAEQSEKMVPWPCDLVCTELGPCSQPTLVKGPGEELFVESQKTGEGMSNVFHSMDGGCTWSRLCDVPLKCTVPPGFTSLGGPSPLGIGALSDGTLLVSFRLIYNDGSGRYSAGVHDDPSFYHRTWVTRSTNRGLTWQTPVELDPSPYENIGGQKVRFHQLPDGTVLLPMSCDRWSRPGKPLPAADRHQVARIYASTDGGQTWRVHGDVGRHSDETDFLVLPNGRILAATRYQRSKSPNDPPNLVSTYSVDLQHRKAKPDCPQCVDPTAVGGHSVFKHMALCHSDDGGRSFSPALLVTGWLQQTGCLIRTNDGVVLMPFSHKDAGQGQRFMASCDDGDTWTKVVFELHVGGMYASSVVLEDRTVVTVFAAGSNLGGDDRLGLLRWQPPSRSQLLAYGFFAPRPVEIATVSK